MVTTLYQYLAPLKQLDASGPPEYRSVGSGEQVININLETSIL